MIPAEAVDAALRAWGIRGGLSPEGIVRNILEAAAPYLRAGALEDAAQEFEDGIGVAEFDELSRRDGGHWAHIEDAWEHQGPYMDWLRARAAAERGGE